jgi:RNA polymerase sigma factor (sigma-70 family)
MSDAVRTFFTPALPATDADTSEADARIAAVYAAEIDRLAGFGRLLMGGDAAAGEDVAHEVFMELLGHQRKDPTYLRDPAWPWLRTALVHNVLDRKRQMARELKRLIRVYQPAAEPAWSDETADLGRALATLPDRMRACFVLHFAQDMTYAQVGETLGCAPRTVETQVGTARKRLADFFGTDLDDSPTSSSQE